jgi:hypothetical protein
VKPRSKPSKTTRSRKLTLVKLPVPRPVAVPDEIIERNIHVIRNQKVMLDRDLADLYQVSTKALNQAVKRNAARFPSDFMFQLTMKEAITIVGASSKSQIVTLNKRRRGHNIKHAPYAFTEQGVAMLASVLKSSRAVQASITIVRVFVKLRQTLATHQEFARRLDELEERFACHDAQLATVFDAIRDLMQPQLEVVEPPPPKRRFGFTTAQATSPASRATRK